MYDLYQYNSSFVQTFIHYDVIPWADAIHVQLIDKNVQELINEKNNKSVFKLYHCCMIWILDKQNRVFALIERSLQLQAWLHKHKFSRVVQ